MPTTTHPVIAAQGWRWIIPFLGLAIVAQHLCAWWLAGPLLVFSALSVFLFRDPRRDIPSSPLAVVAPVDGHVIAIDKVDDPFLSRPAICVQVRSAWTATYSLRSPVEGKMIEAHSASIQAQQFKRAWVIRTDEDDEVVVAMHGGFWPLRGYSGVRFGERIGQGKRCGAAPLNMTVNLYLAANTEIHVHIGDKVTAGSDVLAALVHAN